MSWEVSKDDERDYAERTLAYVRHVLDCPPRWASAKDAATELKSAIRADYPTVVGAVCFFDTEPWGDIGVYVGSGQVLRLVHGDPQLQYCLLDANYIGWLTGHEFRVRSQGQNPLAH